MIQPCPQCFGLHESLTSCPNRRYQGTAQTPAPFAIENRGNSIRIRVGDESVIVGTLDGQPAATILVMLDNLLGFPVKQIEQAIGNALDE